MNIKNFWLLLAIIVNFTFGTPAIAHAMLISTLPLDKSTISNSPKTIELKFGHLTKLTSLKLISADKELSIPVNLSSQASSTFSVPLPILKPNTYRVKWSTLSGDGHVMTGSFLFTISGP